MGKGYARIFFCWFLQMASAETNDCMQCQLPNAFMLYAIIIAMHVVILAHKLFVFIIFIICEQQKYMLRGFEYTNISFASKIEST